MNQYEAMFLFDPAFAPDVAKAKEEAERILQRAEAEILFLEKWDERKLAYEIKGCKRGLYVLCYFLCDGSRISALERDVNLSESVLRVLVTRADGVSKEHMERQLPQKRAADDDSTSDDASDRDSSDDSSDDDRPMRFRRKRPVAVASAVDGDDDGESGASVD